MKIEKLRKNHRSKIIVGGLIGLGVIGAITILPSFAKYKITQDINIANGTVNYKVPDIKVMAMYTSDDGINYTEITTMPTSGYAINEEKTYCTTDNINQVKGKAYTNASGELVFRNLTKSDKCYLYFDKYTPSITIDDIIAANKPKTTPPTFTNAATTNEGMYKVSDGMYGSDSYYFRGAVTNNYVKFANFCWRIIRINGDGTIRLIYDGATCHANGTVTAESLTKTNVAYNSSYNQSNYVGWTYSGTSQRTTGGTASTAKTQLESWYASNITGANATKVTAGKYCNDRDVQSGSTWSINGPTFSYATYKRMRTDYAPTLSCPSDDIYQLNVGLITADEVMYAGGLNANNSSYYLYNGNSYWTMSPYAWGYGSSDKIHARLFIIHYNGQLTYSDGMYYDDGSSGGYSYSTYGLRPVINLHSDIQFKSGTDGTLNNPYEVI